MPSLPSLPGDEFPNLIGCLHHIYPSSRTHTKTPHSTPWWKFSIISLFISRIRTQYLTIYTAQTTISIPCPFSVPTHRRTCPWNRTWHACLLLLHLLPLGIDRVLLCPSWGLHPGFAFVGQVMYRAPPSLLSISNPKSVLSPNSYLVMQVENCVNFLSTLEQIATNSGLHTTQMDFLTDLEVRNPIPSPWAPVRCGQGWLLQEPLRESPPPAFQLLRPAAYTPWLTTSSPITPVSCLSPPLLLPLFFLPPSCKDPCDYN